MQHMKAIEIGLLLCISSYFSISNQCQGSTHTPLKCLLMLYRTHCFSLLPKPTNAFGHQQQIGRAELERMLKLISFKRTKTETWRKWSRKWAPIKLIRPLKWHVEPKQDQSKSKRILTTCFTEVATHRHTVMHHPLKMKKKYPADAVDRRVLDTKICRAVFIYLFNLKLNPEKTELLILSSKFRTVPIFPVVNVGLDIITHLVMLGILVLQISYDVFTYW